MHFFRVFDSAIPDEDAPRARYERTQLEAHNDAKARPGVIRESVRIELVDVTVDQSGVCRILNDDKIKHRLLRTWKLTPRGGMVDCENGE